MIDACYGKRRKASYKARPDLRTLVAIDGSIETKVDTRKHYDVVSTIMLLVWLLKYSALQKRSIVLPITTP